MKEYILCIILGIILYFIIQDSINNFSIGANTVAWRELKPNKDKHTANNEDYNYYYLNSEDNINIDDINRMVRTDFPGETPNLELYPSFNLDQNHNYIYQQFNEYLFYYYTPEVRTRLNIPNLTTQQIVNNFEWARPTPQPLTRWQRFLNTCGAVLSRS